MARASTPTWDKGSPRRPQPTSRPRISWMRRKLHPPRPDADGRAPAHRAAMASASTPATWDQHSPRRPQPTFRPRRYSGRSAVTATKMSSWRRQMQHRWVRSRRPAAIGETPSRCSFSSIGTTPSSPRRGSTRSLTSAVGRAGPPAPRRCSRLWATRTASTSRASTGRRARFSWQQRAWARCVSLRRRSATGRSALARRSCPA
mmetsp:Transcript_80450/g.226167  ORF Transcript_80450/g.226167 Transcript_80450/m.226167 type:complete len:203 (-) Transcript_80450:601-1209(-)